MPSTTLNTRVMGKVDTEANWKSNNPVLLKGEIGYSYSSDEFSAKSCKIGDGSTAWNNLEYNEAPVAYVYLLNENSGTESADKKELQYTVDIPNGCWDGMVYFAQYDSTKRISNVLNPIYYPTVVNNTDGSFTISIPKEMFAGFNAMSGGSINGIHAYVIGFNHDSGGNGIISP